MAYKQKPWSGFVEKVKKHFSKHPITTKIKQVKKATEVYRANKK
jgi:hypothetical protein